ELDLMILPADYRLVSEEMMWVAYFTSPASLLSIITGPVYRQLGCKLRRAIRKAYFEPSHLLLLGQVLGLTDHCHRRTSHSQNRKGSHSTTQHIPLQTCNGFLGRGRSVDVR